MNCTYAQLGSLVVAADKYYLRQVDVLLVPTNVHVSALSPRMPHLTMILLNCASKEVQVNYGCHHRLGTELTFQKVVRQTTEIRRCGITSAIQSATRDANPRNLSRLVQIMGCCHEKYLPDDSVVQKQEVPNSTVTEFELN